jgi:hypothetical protein
LEEVYLLAFLGCWSHEAYGLLEHVVPRELLTATILAMGIIAYFNPILIDLQNAFCLAIFYDILVSIQISPRLRDSSDLTSSSDLMVKYNVEMANDDDHKVQLPPDGP